MKKEFILSFIISFIFLSLGFALLHFELIGYGLSFFVFLPFILGYILGNSVIKKASLVGLIVALIAFFVLLIAGSLEGMGCILMAMPLIFSAIALGAVANYIYKKNKKDKGSNDIIKSSILPFLLFLLFGFFEKELSKNEKEVISVKTEKIFPYSAMQVYETIKSVDTLVAEKSFLMKIDLPVPEKCILEKEAVGGLRICYFSGGTITERITELEKAKILRMDVIDYKLTGRKWLGFKEAIYYFDKVGEDSCKLTRVTTYTSELTPRFYWGPFEKLGINEEHDYVFNNLIRDLKKKYGR